MSVYKGDTLTLTLDLTLADEGFSRDMIQEIELVFGEYTFRLSTGELFWNEAMEKYQCFLDQEETFDLTPNTKYQVRVKTFDNSVKASSIKTVNLGTVLSKEVL